MAFARFLVHFLFSVVVLTTATASLSQAGYKDLLGTLYRKAVQNHKPLVVVLDNKRSSEDREETSGSHERQERGAGSSSLEHHRTHTKTSKTNPDNRLIAKILLNELDNRLTHSKIHYKNRDDRQRQTYQEYLKDQEDEAEHREYTNTDTLKRTRHSKTLNKLKSLLSTLTDRYDTNDRDERTRDRNAYYQENRHRDHKDRYTQNRDSYTQNRDRYTQNRDSYTQNRDRYTQNSDRYTQNRDDRNTKHYYHQLLKLLNQRDDRKETYHDQTRHGHQKRPSYLRSPVGRQLSALRSGLACAAKDQCMNNCFNNYRKQAQDSCNDECEEKFDECQEEQKEGSCENGDGDDCKESTEVGSTKGYAEEPEKYCARC